MKKIKRVYVAGRIGAVGDYSAPIIESLINMRRLIRESLDVFFAGFTPFCPALDHHFFFQLEEGEHITEPMIKRFSKDWLEACEAIYMTPGWKQSKGSITEKEMAEKLGIPECMYGNYGQQRIGIQWRGR